MSEKESNQKKCGFACRLKAAGKSVYSSAKASAPAVKSALGSAGRAAYKAGEAMYRNACENEPERMGIKRRRPRSESVSTSSKKRAHKTAKKTSSKKSVSKTSSRTTSKKTIRKSKK